jgi:hypothetical protein
LTLDLNWGARKFLLLGQELWSIAGVLLTKPEAARSKMKKIRIFELHFILPGRAA